MYPKSLLEGHLYGDIPRASPSLSSAPPPQEVLSLPPDFSVWLICGKSTMENGFCLYRRVNLRMDVSITEGRTENKKLDDVVGRDTAPMRCKKRRDTQALSRAGAGEYDLMWKTLALDTRIISMFSIVSVSLFRTSMMFLWRKYVVEPNSYLHQLAYGQIGFIIHCFSWSQFLRTLRRR